MKNDSVSHVQVMSLGHSGSTLMNLLLGTHPDFVSLGEVMHSFMYELKNPEAQCSCGEPASTCVFWGKVLHQVSAESQLDIPTGYQAIFETFQAVYPSPKKQFADSSKSLEVIKLLDSTLQRPLKVVFVIRDVRSYTISQIDNLSRKFSSFNTKDKILRNSLIRSRFYFYLDWYYRNLRIRSFLERENIPYIQVGYEEVCLRPDLLLGKIFRFLEVEKPAQSGKQQSAEPAQSESHIIRSNRMRLQKGKQTLSYDTRWLTRNEWILPAAIFPGIMRFNAREVYANISSAERKKWSV
ncbi:MAG: sulfotransferase [Cyanobacteria bacterium P01_D01_bin.44]